MCEDCKALTERANLVLKVYQAAKLRGAATKNWLRSYRRVIQQRNAIRKDCVKAGIK